MPSLQPFGSGSSSLSAQRAVAGEVRLSQVRLHAGRCHWLEGRPTEGGRQVVCRGAVGEPGDEATPADVSVRARVHEYGGGDYTVGPAGLIFVVDAAEARVERIHEGTTHAIAGLASDARHAEPVVSPDGRWLVLVEERPGEAEPENRIVALPLAGGALRVVEAGHDFVSSPCFSPDGSRLAYLAWDHPDMPWDATLLCERRFGAAGPGEERRIVAGGPGESIFQPSYSPAGRLTFVSDRGGFGNLHQECDGEVRNLCPREQEFGTPQWVLGLSTHGFVAEDRIACVVRAEGRDRVAVLDRTSGSLTDCAVPLANVASLAADAERIALIGSAEDRAESVFEFRLSDGRFAAVREESPPALPPEGISRAESFWFDTAGGERAHAFFYPPTHESLERPAGERPPLLVKIHGGPTAAASPGLDLGIQFWTQRGFAIADVNHRGSTGFGRAYRERLNGGWGVVEVEDCVAVARALAARGDVDAARMGIRGGSAGGFSALSALVFHDVFASGCSRYGIGDLAALARDTHKFEARYLDRLVAPWPEGRETYAARSPLQHVDRLRVPVIFFQGLEDRIVPPSQTETFVAALAARGVPHAYVTFPGEGHGFRRAETLVTCLEAERWFHAHVFGIDAGEAPAGVRLHAGDAREL